MDDLPSVRLLRGEDARAAADALGRPRHRRGAVGAAEGGRRARRRTARSKSAVTIIEDVTEASARRCACEFLARVGELLASSLDYQQTLRNVAGLAVPQIADWCAVDLFDDDGGREPVAVAHVDPAKLELAERMRAYEPEQLDPEQGLGLVLRTGESVLYTDIPDELLVDAAVDEEHLRLLRAVGMRAVLIVPLTVARPHDRRADDGQLRIGAQLRRRATSSSPSRSPRAPPSRSRARACTASARRVARTLQNSLLPEAIPEIPGWEVAALYRPAGHESEVGGDFYDFWEVGRGLADDDRRRHRQGRRRGGADLAGPPHRARGLRIRRAARARSSRASTRRCAGARRCRCARRCACACRASGATRRRRRPPAAAARRRRAASREVGEHGTLLGALAHTQLAGNADRAARAGETLVAFTDGVTDTVGEDGERWGTERLARTLAGAPTTRRRRAAHAPRAGARRVSGRRAG